MNHYELTHIYEMHQTNCFFKAHDIALDKREFDKFVAGHLTRLGTRNDVAVQKEFMDDLKNAAMKANQEVIFSTIAQQVEHFDNPWLIYSKYIDAVNEKCTQLLLPKGKIDSEVQGYL